MDSIVTAVPPLAKISLKIGGQDPLQGVCPSRFQAAITGGWCSAKIRRMVLSRPAREFAFILEDGILQRCCRACGFVERADAFDSLHEKSPCVGPLDSSKPSPGPSVAQSPAPSVAQYDDSLDLGLAELLAQKASSSSSVSKPPTHSPPTLGTRLRPRHQMSAKIVDEETDEEDDEDEPLEDREFGVSQEATERPSTRTLVTRKRRHSDLENAELENLDELCCVQQAQPFLADKTTKQRLRDWESVVANYKYNRKPVVSSEEDLQKKHSLYLEKALKERMSRPVRQTAALRFKLDLLEQRRMQVNISVIELGKQKLRPKENHVLEIFCNMYLRYYEIPMHQRCGSSWDSDRKNAWLETLLFNPSGMVAPILLYTLPKHPDSFFWINDGNHRLLVILKFLLGKLNLKLSVPSKDKTRDTYESVELSFFELPRDMQKEFLKLPLLVKKMQYQSHEAANQHFGSVNMAAPLDSDQRLITSTHRLVLFITNYRGERPGCVSFDYRHFVQLLANRQAAHKTPYRFPVVYHTDNDLSSNAFEKYFTHFVNVALIAYTGRETLAGTTSARENQLKTLRSLPDLTGPLSRSDAKLSCTVKCLEFFFRLLLHRDLSFSGRSAEFYSLLSLYLARQKDFASPDSSTELASWYMNSIAAVRSERQKDKSFQLYFEATEGAHCNSNVHHIETRRQFLVDLWDSRNL